MSKYFNHILQMMHLHKQQFTNVILIIT